MNRFNSTIKQNKCKCGTTCKHYPSVGFGGYYYAHAPEEIKERQGDKAKKTYQNKLKRQKDSILSRKLHEVSEAKGDKLSGNLEAVVKPQGDLSVWFVDRMKRLEAKCENCQSTKPNLKFPSNEILWKSCQAHLLPKRHFKSLETHPLNGMVLGSGFSGLCHCHDIYDSSWTKAAKMVIWEEVVRRFLIMYPLITPEEHRFIPPQLLQELPDNQI